MDNRTNKGSFEVKAVDGKVVLVTPAGAPIIELQDLDIDISSPHNSAVIVSVKFVGIDLPNG